MHTNQPINAFGTGLHILLRVFISLILCLHILHENFFLKFGNEIV